MGPDALWGALPDEVASVIAHSAFEQWACTHNGHYGSMIRDGRHMALINRTFFQAFRPLHLMLCRDVSDPRHGHSFVQGLLLYMHQHPKRITTSMHGFVHTLVHRSCTHKWVQKSGKRQSGCGCGEIMTGVDPMRVCVQQRFLDALTLGLIHAYASGVVPVPPLDAQRQIIRVLSSVFHYMARFHIARVRAPALRAHLQQAFAVVNAMSE